MSLNFRLVSPHLLLTFKGISILLVTLIICPSLSAQTQIGSDVDAEAAGDFFGRSVSISSDGTRIAIGGEGNDGTATLAGHVRVFEESGGSWGILGSDLDGEAMNDQSGFSVAISGDGTRVAVGAPFNAGGGSAAGHVRVYEYGGSSWSQVGSDIDGTAAGDFAGWSVSLSDDGTRVAIGATGGSSSIGVARVYAESGGTWSQVGSDIVGENTFDEFGRSVSLSSDGTRIAIGGPYNAGTATDAGHVRVYDESGGSWSQVGSDIDGESGGDQSGIAVALSGDGSRVAIGALENDGNGSNSGHVRVYSESGSVWSQVGSDLDGESSGDLSGSSVALSSNGTKLAIGAPANTGNGTNAGQIRIYEESGGSWSQVGSDIDGEASENLLGESVSLSSDGSRVINGAPNNDGIGLDAGHAVIFSTGVTLPVELSSFQGKSREGIIELQWQTASELNNRGFEVEKSASLKEWEYASFVEGKGTTSVTTSYRFLDPVPFPGPNYYRLKQIDFDGQFNYSQVIEVANIQTQASLQVSPQASSIDLQLANPERRPFSLSIIDPSGRITWRSGMVEGESNWVKAIPVEVKGTYFISVNMGEIILYERISIAK
ncbi:MAG: hypothetical protein AAF388_10345 [Bacteroidota bacterium]